jgi:hypothetical protein
MIRLGTSVASGFTRGALRRAVYYQSLEGLLPRSETNHALEI